MAKKARHREWWYPCFGDELKVIQQRGFVNDITKEEAPLLFDDMKAAYDYAAMQRMMPMRDADGNVIKTEKGTPKLPNLGKVTLLCFKGKTLDWKKVVKVKRVPAYIKCELIAIPYKLLFTKQNVYRIFEETDEIYERFATSPLAQEGGLEYESTETTNQELLSTTES